MKRRVFITLLGGAAAVAACARAQQAGMPVVGLLRGTPAPPFPAVVAAPASGPEEEDLSRGRNVAIEQRWRTIGSIGCRS